MFISSANHDRLRCHARSESCDVSLCAFCFNRFGSLSTEGGQQLQTNPFLEQRTILDGGKRPTLVSLNS